MQTKYLCVLIHIWIKGEVGAVGPVWALRWSILLTVPGRCFFCGSFMFLFCLVFAVFCARLFVCALWSPAGRGLASWLSFVVSSVSLSLSHWYPGSGVVLDCIDSWSLHHYLLLINIELKLEMTSSQKLIVRHMSFVCLTASFLATGGFFKLFHKIPWLSMIIQGFFLNSMIFPCLDLFCDF